MADQEQAVYPPTRVVLDGRRPKTSRPSRARVAVTAGYVDVFAVSMIEGSTTALDIIYFGSRAARFFLTWSNPPIAPATDSSDRGGGPGAEAQCCRGWKFDRSTSSATWITRLAGLIAAPARAGRCAKLAHEGATGYRPANAVAVQERGHRLGRIASRYGETDGT